MLVKARGNCRNERVRAVTSKRFNGHLNRVCGLFASRPYFLKKERRMETVNERARKREREKEVEQTARKREKRIVKRKIQFTRNRVTAFGSINLSFFLLSLIFPSRDGHRVMLFLFGSERTKKVSAGFCSGPIEIESTCKNLVIQYCGTSESFYLTRAETIIHHYGFTALLLNVSRTSPLFPDQDPRRHVGTKIPGKTVTVLMVRVFHFRTIELPGESKCLVSDFST